MIIPRIIPDYTKTESELSFCCLKKVRLIPQINEVVFYRKINR